MLTAVIGVIGVSIGAFLTQRLTTSSQRRKERLESIVALAAACARVIGAHERLYELLAHGPAPSPDTDLAHGALLERTEAHAQWRTAQARVEIVIAGDAAINKAAEKFGRARAAATPWVLEYQRLGSQFSMETHEPAQEKSWEAMRHARYQLIEAGQKASLRDANRFSIVLRERIRRIFGGLKMRSGP